MKTVSQLAAELNVNRTTLHRLIQRNNIETLQEGNKRLIDVQAEQAILKAFNEKTLQGETLRNNNKLLQQCNAAQAEQLANKDKTIDSLQAQLTDKDNQNSLLKSELDVLKAETKALREQITDRDKTIESLQADKEYLKSKLNESDTERKALESSIDKLTTALTAAQALHGMDKQQKVIEVKEEPKELASIPEPEQKELAEDPPQQKLSFFKRLFRRK